MTASEHEKMTLSLHTIPGVSNMICIGMENFIWQAD
jgi:hypothetical protein